MRLVRSKKYIILFVLWVLVSNLAFFGTQKKDGDTTIQHLFHTVLPIFEAFLLFILNYFFLIDNFILRKKQYSIIIIANLLLLLFFRFDMYFFDLFFVKIAQNKFQKIENKDYQFSVIKSLFGLIAPILIAFFIKMAEYWRNTENMKILMPLATESINDFIFVKTEYKQIKIAFADVLYFESMKDYIKIWLKDANKPILTLMSLKSLEKEIPSNEFMRIHRSFIISLSKIKHIEKNCISIGNIMIPIARGYKTQFNDFVKNTK
jgi:LytTr DNA-binding domain